MASVGGGLSKSAKKNLKRKQKKSKPESGSQQDREDVISPEQLVDLLKKDLAQAKQTGDHKGAASLRQQLWVATDLANGLSTDIDADDYQEILAKLDARVGHLKEPAEPRSGDQPEEVKVKVELTAGEKQLRSLRKKLKQIEELKKREMGGDKLEQSQLDKIKGESELLEEIEELTHIMETAAI